MRTGCRPDSKPGSRGFNSFHRCFSGIHGYRHEQLTTGHSSHFLPGHRRPGRPSLRRRSCAGEDARERATVPGARNAPGTSPAVGQRLGHLIWVEDVGGSSPSSWTRRPQDACYRPSGRHRRALRRKSAPHPAQGTERPWLNRRECLPTKQEGAGSNPAGRAVSKSEIGDARGPEEAGSSPAGHP